MSENKKYGFYSKMADRDSGHVVYMSAQGQEVKVTCVCSSPEADFYKWPDKEYVGELGSFVRSDSRTY